MTKCRVEISMQAVNAQGQIDEHIGDYLCDGFKNEGGTDMSVYSKVPCPDLEYLTCQNCRRLFSNLAELKQHQATCDSEGNFYCKYCGCTNNSEQQKVMHEAACPERTDDDPMLDDELKQIISNFGDILGSLGSVGASDLLSRGNLSNLIKCSPKFTGVANIMAAGLLVYDGYQGYKQDIYQGESNNYNMVRNISGDVGAYLGSSFGSFMGAEIGIAIGGGTGTAASGGATIEITAPTGAVFGGIVGAFLMSYYNSQYGQTIAEQIVDGIYGR